MHRRITRPSPSLVVASLALAVALGGTSYAAIVLPPNSVGTAQLKNGAVVAAKIKKGSLTAAAFRPNALPRGPQGLIGPAGPAGPAGESATKQFAVINGANGGVVRQSGNISGAKPPGQGIYTLTFPQSVSACVPVASVSSTGTTPEEGFVSVTQGAQPNQLNVQTFSSGGSFANRTFTVAVFC